MLLRPCWTALEFSAWVLTRVPFATLALGGLQHAVQTAEHSERQDDLPVFGLLVIPAKEIGDGPDKWGEIRIRHEGIAW